ncbi:MAG: hypothetical protein CL799_01095 [Chromatiales bacterium]|nr:hypothetical protein [Chromatiales bacterium]MDP6150858.1 hypothetical protein [Gammaproteobacteria bacterium]MDP7269735.1 hypothetical protein [Gammaproteobacteria bacterium]HJP03557.1 hypothetical protein [Gammaproteobacteria bacterium]
MSAFNYFLILLGLLIVAGVVEVWRRNVQIWLPAYLKRGSRQEHSGTKHVLFCFVDHFEPRWGSPPYEAEQERVDRWLDAYPKMASQFRDADGNPPKHSFFYPEEEYRKEHLDKLAELCQEGFGEIEIHLHHHDDTETGLRAKLTSFVATLNKQHGLLPVNPQTGQPMFAFIHGNWALDNSAPDGSACGVNNELIVLRELGCYADFTLPSAPDPAQTRKINSIYYATDDPDRPKSHDSGTDVHVGGAAEGDLMIIQGPLALNWKQRKFGLMPKIETSEIRGGFEPSHDRVDLWIREAPIVQGRPDWLFVKIYTHGMQEKARETLLGEPIREMHAYLNSAYNDGDDYQLHYVTAREMYNLVKAAEAGCPGNPNEYRDYELPPPSLLQQ